MTNCGPFFLLLWERDWVPKEDLSPSSSDLTRPKFIFIAFESILPAKMISQKQAKNRLSIALPVQPPPSHSTNIHLVRVNWFFGPNVSPLPRYCYCHTVRITNCVVDVVAVAYLQAQPGDSKIDL